MFTYEYFAGIVNHFLKGEAIPSIPSFLDFDSIVDVANRNHISYMVFSALLTSSDLSEKQIEFLRSSIKNSVFYTLLQDNELKSVCKEFENNEVKSIPLKGAVIRYLYPRPELREMSDIDILIYADDFEKADASLIKLGYNSKLSVKHHDIYTKNNLITIEAHRSMYDKSVDNSQYMYFKGFDKAILRRDCMYTYDLKHEDFYIYLIAHAAKHFYAMGCGIRNLIDIYVYLKKYKDLMKWDYVQEGLEQCGIASFAFHMEKLAFDWLDGKQLDEFYTSLFEYMMDAGIYGKNENGIWNKFADAEKEYISKRELKLWYYFPPKYYMSEYYPWLENHSFLLPLAWCIRFIRGVFLHKGIKKREMVRNIEKDKIITYKTIYQKMSLRFSGKL